MLSVRTSLSLVAMAALSAVLMAGCGNTVATSTASDPSDEETIASFVEDHEFFDEGVIYDQPLEQLESRDAIEPVRVWREITDRIVTREIHVDQEEGTADLAVTKEIWGTLNIVGADTLLYIKPMHHTGNRYATFERIDVASQAGPAHGDTIGSGQDNGADSTRYRRGRWILTAVSGTLISSEVLTMDINWIRIQGPSVDVTVTDPLLLMSVPEDIMRFGIGEEVTVTVSGPPQDALVALHTRPGVRRLQYADGVFSGTWLVGRRGTHILAVQALAHDSIYDSEYPDDCLIWALPYEVIRPDEQS